MSKKLDLSKIKRLDFPENEYYRQLTEKNQITLHHTVSGRGVEGDFRWWQMDKGHIATHVIIAHDGTINQLYSTKYWAHHLGIKSTFLKEQGFDDYKFRNVILNKGSIGVEIDSWGGLIEHEGKFYPARYDDSSKPNLKVKPIEDYSYYPNKFRGFYAFENYTAAQIESVRQLLVFWNERYDIPLDYNTDMWDVSNDALSGKSGVWSHTSYRSDKSDLHPDLGLVRMLQDLI